MLDAKMIRDPNHRQHWQHVASAIQKAANSGIPGGKRALDSLCTLTGATAEQASFAGEHRYVFTYAPWLDT